MRVGKEKGEKGQRRTGDCLGHLKKVVDFPFRLMSETSSDEDAERASKPDKNGKSMKRKS